MTNKAVVTIAIELKDVYNYKDVINEIHLEMKNRNNICPPPIDIKKIENYHVFDGLNFNCGIKVIFNLIFLISSAPGAPGVYFENIKGCLEQIRPKTYNLIAISSGLYHFTEYSE